MISRLRIAAKKAGMALLLDLEFDGLDEQLIAFLNETVVLAGFYLRNLITIFSADWSTTVAL